MAFVLDASVAASWLLEPDETHLATRAEAMLRSDGALVPHLWLLEIRSALLSAERRGRVEEAIVSAFLDGLSTLPIVVDHGQDLRAVMGLARQYRLTVYDAAYLELAQRRSLPLASLDRALVAVARDTGVTLLDEM